MIRADVTKREIMCWDLQHGDGLLFLNIIVGAIGGVGGTVAAITLIADGLILLGVLLLIPILAYVAGNVYLSKTEKLPYIWCCDSYRSETNHCYSITNHWHELNEDNKAIALPLVKWVYEHRHKKDTYGKPMFVKECDRRRDAVAKLLEEQKAIEYHKPDVDDADVEAVLEYVDAMKHARETLYPPTPKAIVPPNTTDTTALVRAYHEKKKVWMAKASVPK